MSGGVTPTTYRDATGLWHALVSMSFGTRGQLSRAARAAIVNKDSAPKRQCSRAPHHPA